MTSFDEGFCYLGTDFSRSFPPVDPRHDIKGRPDPDQVVYVGRDGARVHVSQNRLIVDGADDLPQVSIPAGPSAESSSPVLSGCHPEPDPGRCTTTSTSSSSPATAATWASSPDPARRPAPAGS